MKKAKVTISNKNTTANFLLSQKAHKLEEITVKSKSNNDESTHLKDVDGANIYAAKKSEVLHLNNITGNKSTNNARQLFSHVAGLNIWESDGAGLQLGIAARGLNPNRTSSFNTRLNGYDLSADAIGYPESYYTPTSESLEKIQVVRGAASLQYGTQFGGMLNFITKLGHEEKKIDVNLRQTYGSYGFINSYNSIGGTHKKISYYSYFQHKKADGWRDNSDFELNTGFASMKYNVNPRLELKLDLTIMKYLAHQAGGLTDSEFYEDPRQSKRERNWFQVDWNLGAVSLDYKITEKTLLNSKTYGLIASRNALGNLSPINRNDGFDVRNLLKDKYKNIGNETRLLHRYNLLKHQSNFLVGARIYKGNLDRNQGFGSDGFDADFNYYNKENSDFSKFIFPSYNLAMFTENIFRLTERLSITPGARFEYINTQSQGNYTFITNDLAGNIIEKLEVNAPSKNLARKFPLFGVGISYIVDTTLELYGNISQNYRAITFSDMVVTNPSLVVDSLMKDENGYNLDLGFRGKIKEFLNFDFTLFYLSYKDRIGLVQIIDNNYQIKRLRTNISDSRTYGFESFAEVDFVKIFNPQNDSLKLAIFTNISILNGKYINSENSAYEGRKVELVPDSIVKFGLNLKIKDFSSSYNFSYTSSQFTDATNAKFTSNAVNGLIPSFWVMDASASYKFKNHSVEFSCNNITNKMYFTRRADGYPGPGIIPSEGRSYFLTLHFNI